MRVLVVDDSNTMRRIVCEQLRQLGVTDLLQAPDGQKGFEALETGMPVDLLLLDINLPKMDGLSVLRKVRAEQRFKAVKVIMVTSEAEKQKVLEALRAGADDYIVKPFSPEDFRQRLGL